MGENLLRIMQSFVIVGVSILVFVLVFWMQGVGLPVVHSESSSLVTFSW